MRSGDSAELVTTHIIWCVSEARLMAGLFVATRYRSHFAVSVIPTGLPEGSRWSAGAKGSRPPERRTNCNAPWKGARGRLARLVAWFLTYLDGKAFPVHFSHKVPFGPWE